MIDIDRVITNICEADDAQLKAISINSVADAYREGADLHTLIPLLTHANPSVVECGVWIASEVVTDQRGRVSSVENLNT